MRTRNELGSYLNELGLVGEGAEVGVFIAGFSLKILGQWKGRKLHLVDRWQAIKGYENTLQIPGYGRVPWQKQNQKHWEAVYAHVLKVTAPVKDRVEIHRMDSIEAARKFPDASLDFVYIDGDHSYAAVALDLDAWWPALKPGGLFCGHDFFNGVWKRRVHVGVKRAVLEFAAEVGVDRVGETADKLGTWFFRKPEAAP